MIVEVLKGLFQLDFLIFLDIFASIKQLVSESFTLVWFGHLLILAILRVVDQALLVHGLDLASL